MNYGESIFETRQFREMLAAGGVFHHDGLRKLYGTEFWIEHGGVIYPVSARVAMRAVHGGRRPIEWRVRTP